MQVMASLPFVQDFLVAVHLFMKTRRFRWIMEIQITHFILIVSTQNVEKKRLLRCHAGVKHEGQAYLSLQDLCREFGCEYSYDEINYQATITGDVRKGVFTKII